MGLCQKDHHLNFCNSPILAIKNLKVKWVEKNSPSAKKKELVTLITNYEEAKAENRQLYLDADQFVTSLTGMPPSENLKKHKK